MQIWYPLNVLLSLLPFSSTFCLIQKRESSKLSFQATSLVFTIHILFFLLIICIFMSPVMSHVLVKMFFPLLLSPFCLNILRYVMQIARHIESTTHTLTQKYLASSFKAFSVWNCCWAGISIGECYWHAITKPRPRSQ